MTEVLEPSLFPHNYMGGHDQSQALLDWQAASMDQTSAFGNMNTGIATNYIPNLEDTSLQDISYDNTFDSSNQWCLGGTSQYSQQALIQNNGQNEFDSLIEAKGTPQPAISVVEVTEPELYNGLQEEAAMQDGLLSFKQEHSQVNSNRSSWHEEVHMLPVVQDPDLVPTSSGADFSIVLEKLFGQPIDNTNLVEEQLPLPANVSTGLGIDNIAYQDDSMFAVPLVSDEIPEMGYTSLTATPSLYGSIGPDNGQWSGALQSHNPGLPPPVIAPDATSMIEQILFSDQTQSTDYLQPAHQSLNSTNSLTVADHQHGLSSREGSVAHYDSPRTPQTWNTHQMTPSPNPQIFTMPESVFDNIQSQAMVQAFPSLIGFAIPPMLNAMNNFDSRPQVQPGKPKKRPYNDKAKTKVNRVRENGACVACRARKVPCTVDGDCTACLKAAAGNLGVAKEICLRTKLKDVFISVKDIHNTLDDREVRLRPLISSLSGPSTSIVLTVANRTARYQFRLPLEVKTCASSPSCRWKRLTRIKGIYVTKDVIQAQRFVIVPDSLPSLRDYDHFGRQILAMSNGSHSGSLTQRLDKFLLGYCRHSSDSKLRKFANSTLSVASLSRLVAYGFLNISDGSYELLDRHTGSPITEDSATRKYVSETVHDQLRILAAKGLEPEERYVFSQIDEPHKIFGKTKNGRIVTGICILRLMLLYRDRVVRDTIRLGLPRGGEQHRVRIQKAAFMYKRLTIAYATLCRETTPLLMRWEVDDNSERHQENPSMLALFNALQPAFEEFCNDNVTKEYDELFQNLILAALKTDKRPGKKRKVDRGVVMEIYDQC